LLDQLLHRASRLGVKAKAKFTQTHKEVACPISSYSAALKLPRLQRTVFLLAINRMVLAHPELRIRRGLQMQFLGLIENRAHFVSPARLVRASRRR
jgi:hypothetical protein